MTVIQFRRSEAQVTQLRELLIRLEREEQALSEFRRHGHHLCATKAKEFEVECLRDQIRALRSPREGNLHQESAGGVSCPLSK